MTEMAVNPPMTIRKRSLYYIGLFAILLLPVNTIAQSGVQKPNFVIIMADDLGYGDIGCYGNTNILTPNLDQMAREGLRFTDFHSNGVVCSPTRAALLTGRYQQRSGISEVVVAAGKRDIGLDLSELTFADWFSEHGYTTGIFGKWHLGYQTRFNPVKQGFDEFIGYLSGNVDYHSHVDQAGYEDWWTGDVLKKEKGYSTDLITAHAVDFIKRHRKEPFVLYIPHEAPHYPFQGRESKADREIGGKLNVDFPGHGSGADQKAMYKEMIEVMDEGIGEVINTLKELDLARNTLVMFFADNGALTKVGSNAPLRGAKGSVWEGGHRVPAIAWWPGVIKASTESHEKVMTMDLFPTMTDITTGNVPEGLDGISLKNHMLSGAPLDERDLFWQFKKQRAVYSKGWKLVCLNPDSTPMLFHLDHDLEEKNDLAQSRPVLVHELTQKLDFWEKDVNQGKR